MKSIKLTRKDAIKYGRVGVVGYNYQLSDVESGTSVVYAELTGEHGERVTTNRTRIYYILDGEGIFIIDGKKITVFPEDLITVPPNTKYNYWPTKSPLKCLLYMEWFDPRNLPK